MFSLIVLLILRIGEEQALDDRCAVPLSPVEVVCSEPPPKLADNEESKDSDSEPRMPRQIEQRPAGQPFMPRTIMAGMPQEYQQQIQPMRGFLAAVNWGR